MKIAYFHYYFREHRRRNAPRVCHDIRPIINRYIEYGDTAWKTQLEGDDGEKLLLLPTAAREVFMLLATRHQEIIKAIDTRTLSVSDLQDRLARDETAGFAAYFRASDKAFGLASTLRGPKAAALSRFLNDVVTRLGAGAWQLHFQSIGSSLTLEQARALAFVARATITVTPGNPMFRRLKALLARDSEDVSSFEVTVRSKKNKNLRDVFANIAREAGAHDVEKFRIRAKAALDDDLSDFFVEEEGRLTEEIGTGTERELTHAVATRFAQHPSLRDLLGNMLEESHYEDLDIPELTRLGDGAHWRSHLRGE